MECNKDEAVRAKEIAEKKMKDDDFVGAQKFILKAKNLYPELENITQMLSICDVHCSARRSLPFPGSDKDWYGILQVEKFADELIIKKQYRRLALSLHPDKNRFPGAEGAFKLISEANALLSDSAKKNSYDTKIRAYSRTEANHPLNGSSQLNQQYDTQNNTTSDGFSGLNQHQATQSRSFWTCCPFCTTNYQYDRQYVLRSLLCQKCHKLFVAYEVGAHGVSTSSNLGHQGAQHVPSKPATHQRAVSREKVVNNQANPEIGKQKAKVPSTSHAGSQGIANRRTVQPQAGKQKGRGSESIKVACPAKNLKTKETVNLKASSLDGEKVEAKHQDGDAINGEPRNARTKTKKRRKLGLGLDDSSDNDIEDMTEKEKVVNNQANPEIGKQNAKVPSTSHAGSEGIANRRIVQPQAGKQKGRGSESIKVADSADNLKTKESVNLKASSLHCEKVEPKHQDGDAINGEPRNARTKTQKRRKLVLGSGDSSDDDIEVMTEQENLARRSSRRRHNVSYKETDEDYHAQPLKTVQTTKEAKGKEQTDVDSEDSKHVNQHSFPTAPVSSKVEDKETGAAHSEESLKDKNEGFDTFEIESDSDLDSHSSIKSDAECFECPDPEFSDFDKLRDESNFNVNQYWACYDSSDGMPRFYAKVTKIHPSPFELQIKWLEAVPINDTFERWIDGELPVSCGSFKLGQPDKLSGCLTLSHQVHFEKGMKKNSFIMYPKEGEVWAIFRDWDIGWNPEDDMDFRYEIVEVLSDFVAGVGIKVGYLDKINGFVCLFQRASPIQTNSFVIGPTELYKFSHHVPSFKMTGAEREGVPKGSFELDPAALPLKPEQLFFPSKENSGSRSKNPRVNSPLPKYAEVVDLEGTRDEASKFRRSPRGVNVIRQNTKWCNRVVPPTTSVHQDW